MAFSCMNIYFFRLLSVLSERENMENKRNFDFARRRYYKPREFVRLFEDVSEGDAPFVCTLVLSFSNKMVQDVSVAIDRAATSLILQVV